MIKSNVQPVRHRHFFVWSIALFVFAFLEWRHPGFVSFVFPFPILIFLPGVLLLVEHVLPDYREK